MPRVSHWEKWWWVFTKPGVRRHPAPSIRLAPGGTAPAGAGPGPTAVILPPETTRWPLGCSVSDPSTVATAAPSITQSVVPAAPCSTGRRLYRRTGGGHAGTLGRRPAASGDGRWLTPRGRRGEAAARGGHHPRAGLRAPPPLLGPRARDAGAASHPDRVRRDPRADLVEARRGARRRDAAVVGDARRARGPRVRDDRDRRPPRGAVGHRGKPRRHRRRLRQGGGPGPLLLRRDRPARTRRRAARPWGERALPPCRRAGHGRGAR